MQWTQGAGPAFTALVPRSPLPEPPKQVGGPVVGRRTISEELRQFVREFPWERQSILDFVADAAGQLEPDARVADIGAGDAPYRELFAHANYVTVDWGASPHEGATSVDLIASADHVPLSDASFDAVLLTQVLEHVSAPDSVLSEARRLLRAGGTILLTVPLVWELHELPHDYYRYTQAGLHHLLDEAGFVEIEVRPRNDCFTTLAQLMRNVTYAMGREPDGLNERREEAARLLWELSESVAALAPLDSRRILPLGYAGRARRPPTPSNGMGNSPAE